MFMAVFGLENTNTSKLFMFRTVLTLKKMNTFHLFMISINMPTHVQSVSGRQALYDLGYCFIDRSGRTTEYFF